MNIKTNAEAKAEINAKIIAEAKAEINANIIAKPKAEVGNGSNANYLVNESTKIRTALDCSTGILYYSIVDAVFICREAFSYEQASKYWSVVKHRVKKKAEEKTFHSYKTLERNMSCVQVKVLAKDNKMRYTDFATKDHIINIIEYISFSKVIDCYGIFKPSTARLPCIQYEVLDGDIKYISELLDRLSNEPRFGATPIIA